MNFFQKFRDFISRPTHSRTIGILIFFILVIAVSLTVYVAQQQQQLRQRASGPAQICSNIDSISDCNFDPNNMPSCNEGDMCKIGNVIYECQ